MDDNNLACDEPPLPNNLTELESGNNQGYY
jgi:hypothetical protein